MEISIVVPIRNEKGTIEELVKRTDAALKAAAVSYEIIFVDFHSQDGTVDVVTELAKMYPVALYDQKSKGKAMAVLEGIEYAKSDTIVMIDGDLQYPPEAIPEMFKKRNDFPVVVARRQTNNEKFIRKFASRVHAFFYCQLLFGLTCDVQSGLKLFPKDLIKHINLDNVSPWTLDLSLLWAAKQLGYAIGEVPITFDERVYGASKVNIFKSFYEHSVSSLKVRLNGSVKK